MKKLVIILGSVFMLSATSCVKQKSCEEGISGTFQYLKEPIPYECDVKKEVTAILYIDDEYKSEKHITGQILKKYKSENLIKVRAVLKPDESFYSQQYPCLSLYKLKCIEKED